MGSNSSNGKKSTYISSGEPPQPQIPSPTEFCPLHHPIMDQVKLINIKDTP